MYCSTPLPSPRPGAADELPDLDQLVRDTLSGRKRDGLRQLTETLQARPEPPPRPLPRVIPAPPPPEPAPPVPVPAAALEPVSATAALPVLQQEVAALARALDQGDDDAAQAALTACRRALDDIASTLLDEETDEATDPGRAAPAAMPHTPSLPSRPHPWALVVDGIGDPGRGAAVAEALGVDRATARQIALGRTPRVARWGDQPAPLRAAAQMLRSQAGVGAMVVHNRSLRKAPLAITVLGPGPDPAHLETTVEAGWLEALSPSPPRRFERWDDVVLAVPGDVLVRRYRQGTRGPSPAGERRVRVVDLHSPTRCLRVVLGVTELRGLPGFVENSALKSLQQLATGLPWPGARALPARTTSTSKLPRPDAFQGGSAEVGAWPAWEEYTRLARALAGLGSSVGERGGGERPAPRA